MMRPSDDFATSFAGCPLDLREHLSEALELQQNKIPEARGTACLHFFTMGIQLYGLSRWMCNDYIPLYQFSGDCFKNAAGTILTVDPLPNRQKARLAMFWYGRAGHAYRASNALPWATYCFFRAYEIAIGQNDVDLTKYFANEGWKCVADQWLLLPQVFGYQENEWSLDEFILRLDGYDFQWLIWFLLQKKNFEVEVAKRTRDGGIDLTGTYNDKEWLIRKKIIVQCKNPTNKRKKTTVSTVREMIGVYHLEQKRPNEMMLVTTTDFTAEARLVASDSGVPLILINKEKLFELLKSVYEVEVFSDDAPIDTEEKGILLSMGVKDEFLSRLYERQNEVSQVGYFIALD